MASVNKVILVGNLGHDPETRSFTNGGMIVTLRVATSDRRKAQGSDQWQDFSEWHNAELSHRLAEIAQQHLRKGDSVYLEGSLRTRKWIDKATQKERYATLVRVETLQMLGSPNSKRHTSTEHYDESGYGDYNP